MTLTEAAYWTRRLGVIFAGGFAILMLIFYLIYAYSRERITVDILKPNFACTATPEEFLQHRLSIPSLVLAANSEEIIEIDTPSGRLDEQLPGVANVYEYNDPGPSLSAQNKARDIAKRLGFDPALLQRRGANEYYWNEDPFGRSLSVQADTLNFRYWINYLNPQALPADNRELPTEQTAIQRATAILRGGGWLLEDYAKDQPTTTLINVEPDGTFSMARSRAEAELIRVDFYRSKPFLSIDGDIQNAQQIAENLQKDYLGYQMSEQTVNSTAGKKKFYNFTTEVVNLNTQKSNISVYIGPKYQRDKTFSMPEDIYGIDYNAWVVENDNCGTYPLIPASTLSNMITQGNASLVYLNDKNGDTVIPYQPRTVSRLLVKQVRLAYLDLTEKQRFLQPIYIVIGEASLESGISGTFYFYIPAVDYQNLQPRTVETAAPVEKSNDPFQP